MTTFSTVWTFVRKLFSFNQTARLARQRQVCVRLAMGCAIGLCVLVGIANEGRAQMLPVADMDLPQPAIAVLDLANELPDSQEARLVAQLENLEAATGWKLRVLTQFDRSPGRAVKDYWQLDERSVLMVADPRGGNLLAFNVGDAVRPILPRTFWIELQSRFGNQFFIEERGEASSIQATVDTLDLCFRQGGCRVVPGLPDEQWLLTLVTSIAGGVVCGFAGKPRQSDELFNWQWALIFSPLWLILFVAFGLGPVLSRTTELLPVARNALGFVSGVLTIYVLPFPAIARSAATGDKRE